MRGMMHNNGIGSIPVFCVDFFTGTRQQRGTVTCCRGRKIGTKAEQLQQISGLWRSEHEGKERNGGCDMVNKKMRKLVLTLGMSLAIVSLTAGCSQLKKPQETETQTQSETETQKETESETQSETETELQTDIAYTSQDKSVQITLPDSTWKVTQDADEMRVFSSGSAAMINIVHAADDTQMKNVSVYESEDALKESLTKQYTGSDAFEVQSFEAAAAGTLKTYEYVVKYNSTSMWSYSITYAILADHEAYVIQGTVTDDNKVLLEAVKKSVESFKVLGNSVFNLTKTGTVQNQSETNESETEGNADAELKTLQDYSTAATLYANDDVNVRQDPSKENDDNIIGSLEKGQAVTVVGETSSWFKVNVDGNIGYVSKEFLVSSPVSETGSSETGSSETNAQTDQNGETGGDSSAIDAEKNSQVNYDGSSTLYTTTDVNVRQEPGTGSGIVDGLGSGEAVTVIGETDNWYVVSVNGTVGYISKSYLGSSQTQTGGNDGNTGGNDGGSDENNGGSTGYSGTISGTVSSISGNSITISGDDGNTYTINTSDASIDTSGGVYTGLYVSASVKTASDGSLIATSVTGH